MVPESRAPIGWTASLAQGNAYPFVVRPTRMLFSDEFNRFVGLCHDLLGHGGALADPIQRWTCRHSSAADTFAFRSEADRVLFVIAASGD